MTHILGCWLLGLFGIFVVIVAQCNKDYQTITINCPRVRSWVK
jgi:hypothetical protein